ncbi:MAG: hypothetical protein OES84_00970 [Kiritimatiellaceae bacterium]|nr:hypothetical protein [Kiritimatiellaceae bacterium]
MTKLMICSALISASLLLNGCITRTYFTEPETRGSVPEKKKYGSSNPNSKVTSKKRIWFWQDEFRNP